MNNLDKQEGTLRTWTLTIVRGCVGAVQAQPLLAYRDGERIEVIELEPVLDLLERVEDWLQVPDYQRYEDVVAAKTTLADVEALLRAHGRLKGASDGNL